MEIATRKRLCKGQVYLINGMGVNFKDADVEPIKANDDKISLAYVGEISKRKNQIFLVKAMKRLDNYTLTLVGDGDGREEIERFAKKNNLLDRVHITGFTKQAYQYIKGCDIYVSASTIEGLPFNIMEAMYLGKPIVASDIKGQHDILPRESLYRLNNEDEYVSLVKKVKLESAEYNVEKYALDKVLKENMIIYLKPLGK